MQYDNYEDYDGPLDYEGYQFLHRVEVTLNRIMEEHERNVQRVRDVEKGILDLKASRFADRLEREIDLETWNGIHAAEVGHDLEEAADKLAAAIEAYQRGEDIGGALADVHCDLCITMAVISTGMPGDEE